MFVTCDAYEACNELSVCFYEILISIEVTMSNGGFEESSKLTRCAGHRGVFAQEGNITLSGYHAGLR